MNHEDKKKIIDDFPNIQFNYIKNIKNQAKADLYCAIPKGRKYFAWFTNFKKQNICVFLEYKNNEIVNCFHYNVCCSDDLFYGTILYGTIFTCKKLRYFSIEDVYQYQYKWVKNM